MLALLPQHPQHFQRNAKRASCETPRNGGHPNHTPTSACFPPPNQHMPNKRLPPYTSTACAMLPHNFLLFHAKRATPTTLAPPARHPRLPTSPPKRLSDSPMHLPKHPNAPATTTRLHAKRYTQPLSNPVPSLPRQPCPRKPAQLPVRLPLLHCQTHLLRRPDAVANNVQHLRASPRLMHTRNN